MRFTAKQQLNGFAGRTGLSAVVVAALLVGCTSSPRGGVQVVDRTHGGAAATAAQQRQPVSSGSHRVQPGDTLYSIAFRFGWDWKALAVRNNIPPPYVIRPGQTIRFDGQQGSAPVVVAQPNKAPTTLITQPAVVTRPPVGQTSTPTQPPVAVSKPPLVTTPATTKVTPVARSAKGWAWPTSGVLIGKFSSNGSLNKGVDIAGELGQPVLAAADGSVVYAGSGLRGYGELVIIKHSDTYVSAYGHNRRLLVREGQQVKVGQNIAEMGSTGTDRVKLHFEIRRQGKPVDPLQYLPSR
ncbi:peptidoglycan DD-metalloendopeptidase family protein [Pseudomonas sp. PDM14]|uniref:peptidoglycan DD-metalloendopeptidase family protein n=1 Tax=Pseudomonas sp. PDM14 TaxID=2769288 RepID=UPI0017872CDF|nr:peptidoglycan DD-metalloendopeptidase family protein [Pseudomonas sp. PDM14]MBD9482184.1 peptidoglycan DD-metalloendopeptidase family protein [Pseudomonas sp. PDM14]